MALIECEECSKEVSDKAKFCPHCGVGISKSNNFGFVMPKRVPNLNEYIPEVAAFWHPTKNGDLTPENVRPDLPNTVWWFCSTCEEEWEDLIRNRHRGPNVVKGCPFCSNRRVGKKNSLAALHPEISKEWHPIKNKSLTPNKVVPGSARKVWWVCNEGHEWEEGIRTRLKGSVNQDILGCPYCSGSRLSDKNRLSITYPELIAEWHPTKNGDLTPDDVTYGSHKKVWWMCLRGHEWQSTVNKRAIAGRNCPQCFLKTSFPEQAIYYYILQVFLMPKVVTKIMRV